MWVLVFFDLPVGTKKERKQASGFRKDLLKDGFGMMQFSVYIRHCPSQESANAHIGRVRKCLPPKGQVSILQITDRQYANIINYWETGTKPLPEGPRQLEMF
jgi:CRISPR-associated protein Cas2